MLSAEDGPQNYLLIIYKMITMTKKRIIIFIISIMFIFIISGVFFSPVLNVLSIRSRKAKPQRFYSMDGYSKGFIISYTHSVNKGRIHDYYKHTEDDKLELYKTSFVSYGAGIPEPDETPGAVFTVTDSNYEISGLNRIVPRLVMAVGLTAEHSIIFDTSFEINNKEFFLTDFFEPQTSIILEYKKVSLFSYIRHEIK